MMFGAPLTCGVGPAAIAKDGDAVQNFDMGICLFFFPTDLFDSRWLMPVDESTLLDS